MADTYEILADEVTIHKMVGEVRDPISNQVLDVQQGQGKTYLKGEVVPKEKISPILLAALDDPDHPSHEHVSKMIRSSSDAAREDTAQRLGVPFAGYDDMDPEEIVAAMRVLPSATVQRIKEYESSREDPRTEVVDFNIGFREHPDDRIEGRVGGGRQDPDEDKAVNELVTREVTEDSVQRGEGYTGTGDPQVPHGSTKAAEDKPANRRRSRRARPTPPKGNNPESNES